MTRSSFAGRPAAVSVVHALAGTLITRAQRTAPRSDTSPCS
ncbi:hypothetical protein AB0L10_18950 [Streptomyces flaveolus]